MSETLFTSSGGVAVEELAEANSSLSRWRVGGAIFRHTPNEIEALREFFLHERDKELGRWRFDRGSRVYVVYPSINGSVRVLEESTGQSEVVTREAAAFDQFAWANEVADSYFAAHPDPKPWHDAKPGEIWVITTENVADEVAVQVTPEGTFQYNDGHAWAIQDMPIRSARRIWPEAVSDD